MRIKISNEKLVVLNRIESNTIVLVNRPSLVGRQPRPASAPGRLHNGLWHPHRHSLSISGERLRYSVVVVTIGVRRIETVEFFER